ncbi:MAG: nucleotidyl transferase AbiEii/AbiGii toxin family protein [Bryobacteraceae bacterium]|nr:nucleotidyl transferase AbiEii/AbiGii toxin family protein [Bryobacteraceae bacterium]
MIPRAHITAWRRTAPWSSDAQVEQDLVISRALVEIYSDLTLSSSLAFRGGTALHKLYLSPASRYSEDIDLVQIEAGAIGSVISGLRSRLDPWLGEPRRKQSEGRMTLLYRFESEVPPVTPLRLKIEVNTREHFSVLGLARKRVAVVNPWFDGAAELTTYELEELLATKLRAFYQRKKGRDLFDLSTALVRFPSLDAEKVIRCFQHYMEVNGARVSRAEFEANLAGKLSDPVFHADVAPLLVLSDNADVQFNVVRAAESVQHLFLSRLPGEPWKGLG